MSICPHRGPSREPPLRLEELPARDPCSLCTHVVLRTVCSTLHVSTAGISLDREFRLARKLSSATTFLSVTSLTSVKKLIRSSRVKSHADVVATFLGIPIPCATMLSWYDSMYPPTCESVRLKPNCMASSSAWQSSVRVTDATSLARFSSREEPRNNERSMTR